MLAVILAVIRLPGLWVCVFNQFAGEARQFVFDGVQVAGGFAVMCSPALKPIADLWHCGDQERQADDDHDDAKRDGQRGDDDACNHQQASCQDFETALQHREYLFNPLQALPKRRQWLQQKPHHQLQEPGGKDHQIPTSMLRNR